MRRLPRTTYLVDFFFAATFAFLRLITVLRTAGSSSSTVTERLRRTAMLGSDTLVRLRMEMPPRSRVSTPTPTRVLPSVRVRELVSVREVLSAFASALAPAAAPCCVLVVPWFAEPAAWPLVSPVAFWAAAAPWPPALSCDVAAAPEEPEDPVVGVVLVWA